MIQCVHKLRQLDCLRQLVVVLCERSQLQDLVQFPYVNLHDEVRPSPTRTLLVMWCSTILFFTPIKRVIFIFSFLRF